MPNCEASYLQALHPPRITGSFFSISRTFKATSNERVLELPERSADEGKQPSSRGQGLEVDLLMAGNDSWVE